MNCSKPTHFGRAATALAVGVIVIGLSIPAYCEPDEVALLLQQAPVNGGTITPSEGIHYFEAGNEAALTAVPNPGYQFVYWLGDVSDPTSSRTIAYLDSPKIIIAVFERAKYEFAPFEEEPESGPGGGLYPSAPDYSNQGFTGGGAKRPPKFHPSSPPEEEETENDFPVPDEGNDFPVPDEPIPEPATGMLLILGGLAVLAKRRIKR